MLGVKPGPVVGEALRYLLELRLEEGPLGEDEARAPRRLVGESVGLARCALKRRWACQRSGVISMKGKSWTALVRAVPVAVRVVGRGHAQDVHADAVARARVADPVPALALVGQQVGDVALVPDVAARLVQVGRRRRRRGGTRSASPRRRPGGSRSRPSSRGGARRSTCPRGTRRRARGSGRRGRRRAGCRPPRRRATAVPTPGWARRPASSAAMARRMASARARSVGSDGSASAASTAATRSVSACVIPRSVPRRCRPVALAHLPTPLEPMDRLGAALGHGAGRAVGQARRLHRPGRRRQQGAQARVPVRRRAAAGLRHARHRRRPPEQPRADDRGRRQQARPGVHDRAGRRPAVAPDRQRRARLRARRPTSCGPAARLLRDRGGHRGRRARGSAEDGRRPYRMPVGGATAVGALGYVDGGRRAARRSSTTSTSSSSPTAPAAPTPAWSPASATTPGPRRRRRHPARPRRAGPGQGDRGRRPWPAGPRRSATLRIDHDRFGDGYGAPTDACREALDLAARLEGLILDPVYSGKAMAGLIAVVADGRIARDQRVVFLHTGGMPACSPHAYAGGRRRVAHERDEFVTSRRSCLPFRARTMRVRGTMRNASRQCWLRGPSCMGSGSRIVSTR